MQILKKIKVLCEDTFFRGAFCGAVAGVIKDIIDFIFNILNLDKQPFWAIGAIITYGHPPKGLLINLIGILVDIIFSAFNGFLFGLIARKIKTRHYLLLGTFYGSIVWFFARVVIICYNINWLKIAHTTFHPFIILLLSMLWGIIVARLDRRLSPKTS